MIRRASRYSLAFTLTSCLDGGDVPVPGDVYDDTVAPPTHVELDPREEEAAEALADFLRSRYERAHASGKCFTGDTQRPRRLLRIGLGLAP